MEAGRCFGEEQSLGKGRSGSSRRAKKNSSEKPKQPQRGLGVAQLEKIRISSERGCSSYVPNLHNSTTSMLQEGDARMGGFSSSGSAGSYVLSSSYGYQPNIMMGFGDMGSREIQQESSLSLVTSRWSTSRIIQQPATSMHSNLTRPLLSLPSEGLVVENRRRNSGEYSSSNMKSDAQDIDLDLKLSL